MIKNRQNFIDELYNPLYSVVKLDSYSSFQLLFGGQQPKNVDSDKGIVKASFSHSESKQDTIGTIGGKRTYVRRGFLTIQVLSPYKDQTSLAAFEPLTEDLMRVYEGKMSPSGIVFKDVTPVELGLEDDRYRQTNISVHFEYRQFQ